MSYVKATAEVVTLDVQDVVRTSQYSIKDAEKLMAGISEVSRQLLLEGSIFTDPVLNNGTVGLARLLNDLYKTNPDSARRLENRFKNDFFPASATDFWAEYEADLARCDEANRNRYDAEEEADSFDTEW